MKNFLRLHRPARATLPALCSSLAMALSTAAEPTSVVVDSLAALAEQAGRSTVRVRMKPGVYVLDKPLPARSLKSSFLSVTVSTTSRKTWAKPPTSRNRTPPKCASSMP